MIVNKKILSALTNALKLGLVAENPEAIPLYHSIQPVILVNDRAMVGTIKMANLPLNLDFPGATMQAAYTCPTGKRAYVMSAAMLPTVGDSSIIVSSAAGTDLGPLTVTQAATPFFTMPLGEVWLPAGYLLGGQLTDNIGDVAVYFRYVIVEVDW